MAADIHLNEFDQPVGASLPDWRGAEFPPRRTLNGWGCRLEPLDPERHGPGLWQAFRADSGAMWTYLTTGPYATEADMLVWLRECAAKTDPQFYTIFDEDGEQPLGLASYLRIDPLAGSIEVGWLHFSPALQRSRLATAAMALMMANAFALGYRRYEWKCNVLNKPSWQAALRLGFSYEGTFRQNRVDKGRTRDTAWFSVIDSEWPALQACFARWLAPDNFDERGRQRLRLSELTTACRADGQLP
ncbi:GNAT family N-acetyltransferase [Aeromonas dhakensis]|uniref:GNAT family N-acetyltransferase n=1 Tax=Aeromonas TaxID=642 RepID=UPI00191F92A1|nr:MULTISPECIES: GNAT family protein [Aeromonas]MDD9305880.1 GNAT family N-acetyltransferase [Aeromonas hydrophila]MBL0462636.1 GNAT family N-acetyltransferase [Aeromonas dhakensis]MBL0600435.1 GNAT family N-acetyltransferase [Aeromonas dhakensis]MBL0617948.1 GNAT family N-acetyltransferase [Aeromonas dhakensis]MBL0659945.1 GNAT family N-acetyltransferase [Aeromonas dhakensis]